MSERNLLSGFNADSVDPDFGFKKLPNGSYLVFIEGSETKANKKQTGVYLRITFRVKEGECKGQTVSTFLNLENPNTNTVAMAKSELSAICRAIGVITPNNSLELHGGVLMIDVELRKDKNDPKNMNNTIVKYRSQKEYQESMPEQQNDSPFA